MKSKTCPDGNGQQTCSFLIDRDRLIGTCHRCGRTIPFDPTPVTVRARR